ncbi:MAG: PrsW family glutamic-type intramembrane protease [Candidatus Omnitrophica bacterium]|nr:PrsW family glutamic-type intramembrane protease [Candidatus Omnitrophota bacterium]
MFVLIVAISPAIALVIYFYHKDKYEKEPLGLLARAFFAGAGVTFLAMVIELVIDLAFVQSIKDFFLNTFLRSFLVAGLVEEGLKFLVFKRLIYDNKEFDEPYDGIMYAVMISLGFATIENILYVAISHFKLGICGSLICGSSRAMSAVPAHAFFAVIMGYYLGLAKFCGDRERQREYVYKALGFAVLTHGLYDFFILSRTSAGVIYFFLLMIFCWNFCLRAVRIQVEKSKFKD